MEASKGLVLLAGNSHKDFADLVAQHLNVQLGKCNVFYYSNKETGVDIHETLRSRDVYIIQTGTKNVNNDIMELLIMLYGCKTSCARSITVAMPYMPYCKQSKMRKRGSIVSQLMAKMLCKAGMNQVITMDLHAKEIQGFYDVPVDNLRASPFLIKYVEECIPDYRNAVIVARNPNAVHRATSYAERLRLPLAVIHGEEQSDSENTDGRNSPPLIGEEKKHLDMPVTNMTRKFTYPRSLHVGIELLPMMQAKEKPPLNIVGDVSGHIAIIVDDIIDDVDQFVTASQLLHERGAYKVFVMATHGLLSSDAPRKLEESVIDEVVVTNTVPHHIQKMQCHKIKTVDVSILMAEAIRRIHNNESMSYLFMNIPKDD